MGENSREDFALVVKELSDDPGREIVPATGVEDAGTPGGEVVERKEDVQREEHPAHEVSADQKPEQKKTAVAAKPLITSLAPQSWKPEEREAWKTGNVEVMKTAIARREREMEKGLAAASENKKFKEELDRIIAPYLPMIAAEDSNPMLAISNLFKMAGLMRTGTAAQKAYFMANTMADYNVDPWLFDHALSAVYKQRGIHPADPGNVQPQVQDQLGQVIDQKLAPMYQFMNQLQALHNTNDANLTASAQQTWEEFEADPANEFAKDVKEEMGILLESYANANKLLSLSDAYRMATMAHPTISKLVSDRQQASGAAQRTAAAQRALNAAASISSSGGAPGASNEDEGDGSLRSDIMSSVRTLSARR